MMTADKIKIKIIREKGCEDLPFPRYQTEGSSGVDLYAAVKDSEVLNPGEFKLISTGIRVAIPQGFEGQVRPRSGLALRDGIGLLNSPGTIDSDYRGVVGVILFNFGKDPFVINRGDRIAQLVICKYFRAEFVPVDKLDASIRSSGGFGSTGIR